MIIVSQKDSRWKWDLIGKSYLSIGGWGCLITSLSMLSDWYGEWKTPKWMAKNLNFTTGGCLYWTSLNGKMPFNFVYRYYKRDDSKIKSILYSKDNACVLEVPYGKYKHWVALIGFDSKKGYKIADPIDGKIRYLFDKYSAITGFAEIARK